MTMLMAVVMATTRIPMTTAMSIVMIIRMTIITATITGNPCQA